MNNQEGYIKYTCNWIDKSIQISDDHFYQLNLWRTKLFDKDLIGVLPDGIGYGNISIREKNNKFIISGSATGQFQNLNKDQFARVLDYSINKNSLSCEGKTKASSESLSHAAVYESNSKVNAVIHIHDTSIWNKYFDDLPTTNKKAEYGTPEIALSIKELLSNRNILDSGIIIMGGHPDGIITFGVTIEEAYNHIIKIYNKTYNNE